MPRQLLVHGYGRRLMVVAVLFAFLTRTHPLAAGPDDQPAAGSDKTVAQPADRTADDPSAKSRRPPGAAFQRMAAWDRCIAAVDEKVPNTAVLTYVMDVPIEYQKLYLAAKLVAGVETSGGIAWPSQAAEARVEDFAGGVRAQWQAGGATVRTRVTPLFTRRGADTWEGAALYEVERIPAGPLVVRCGGGTTLSLVSESIGKLRDDEAGGSTGTVEVKDGIALLRNAGRAVATAVKVDASTWVRGNGTSGQYLEFPLPEGKGRWVIAFAKDVPRARELAALDPGAAAREVTAYYDRLLQARIRTPEPKLDEAFRTAILTLDYNWIEPYGWNECIHHWEA
ncbi:MAG: hypothetical protein M1457_12465, partial [bacterium]|nr:hypothetical protein [bacterium]